jgi:endoglucanase
MIPSKIFVFCLIICAFVTSVSFGQGNDAEKDSIAVLLNQVGYLPNAEKIAFIKAATDQFKVMESATGNIVYKGMSGKPQYWSFSGDTVRTADFSAVTKPGTYKLCAGDKCSAEFTIREDVYNEVTKASLKAFYYNRASFAITKEFGGKWARASGHPDTAVIVHESAASQKRPAGTVISSPGGWYDAGDYNKYIVNSGITTYTLLLFYQMYPEYCNSLSINIPESNNGLSDVLNELLYNLNWMLTMQDPFDGGVYSKLTNKGFYGFEMPEKATQPRYVVQKTTAAALDFAAVMAMASRVFSNIKNAHLNVLAKTCMDAAVKAMAWANINPNVYYKQPIDISTGFYGDYTLTDEFFWAKTEIALATGNYKSLTISDIDNNKKRTPGWANVEALGMISLSLNYDPKCKDLRETAIKHIVALTDSLMVKYQSSAFRVSLDIFAWGSNGEMVNQTLLKLIAFRVTGNKKYLPAIQDEVDYILGRNATGYSFITGFGTRSPKHIHHRPSAADGISDPVPGFLVGGPNIQILNDCNKKTNRSKFPGKSYNDEECSFSTNEIAINWNAAWFFVIGAMDAMRQGK